MIPATTSFPARSRSSSLTWVLRFGTYESLLGALLFLAIILTCGLTPMQTDTWWQLRAGRDMWASGQVLLTDLYSHTAYGAFWLNHEWLAEVIFYGLYRLGGLALVTLFSAALIACGWMFTWRMSVGPSRPVFVLILLALVSSAGWWEPRPHAFSLLFIPWMLFLLQRQKSVWLPLLFLVWANCHGGVLLGFALLGIALTAWTFVRPSEWRRSVLLMVGCALGMTATPLGIHFWTEIPRSLSRISLYTLDEWARPEFSDYTLVPFWVIALVYVVMLGRNRSRLRSVAPAEAILHACSLALLVGSLQAVRNVGPFLMIGVPALTQLWVAANRTPTAETRGTPDRRVANLLIVSLAGVAIFLTLRVAYQQEWARLKWTPAPQAAFSALESCPDNLYNRYDEGGMLLWFAPQRRVFLDGRQDPFPARLVLEHIEMETGKRGYKETFARHDIRCAFLPLISPVASQLLTDGWTPLYRDSRWVVLRN